MIPENLSKQIDNYAELIIRKGVNIQLGQPLFIASPIHAADFTRLLAKHAYAAGSGKVTVSWSDDELARMAYENLPVEDFKDFPDWAALQRNSLAEQGAAVVNIDSENPFAFDGIDTEKIAAPALSAREKCKPFRDAINNAKLSWCIAAVPNPEWANVVYPALEDDPEAACEKLWKAILKACHADGDAPVSAWTAHEDSFEKRKEQLNALHIRKLHYTSLLGTDFEIDLPDGAIWHGGCAELDSGLRFSPNIPTEEVYTSPDRLTANGIIYGALPLVRMGRVIRGLWIKFEDGRAVEWGAEEGADGLSSIIEIDEGSHYLGEVALVPYTSAIRSTDTLFCTTLFDENAACHLALGESFPECLAGGLNMDPEELREAGLNDSATHVDFMVGTRDLNIVATTWEGEDVQIFKDGEWAI